MYRLYNEDEGLSNIHDRGLSLRTCIFDDPNPNCITGLYQNAEAFPFPIGSSLQPMAVTRNVAIPSVNFKCAMTIYAKSGLIISVMLNNSFIPLVTEKTTAPSD